MSTIPDNNKKNKPVVITADSTVDLTKELLDRFQIHTVPLTIIIGEEKYLDGDSFSPDDIYKRYHQDGTLPHTAAPSVRDLYDFFKSFTDQGYEVVHLDISAELSGIYQVAHLAAEDLEGVYTIDSRMLSTGIGLLSIEAAECRDRGMSGQEIYEHILSLREKVSTSFVLNTLEFMWKGGRCSGVVALGANLMRIKPALQLEGGKIVVYKKYRGKMEQVYLQYIKERIQGKKIRPGHIFITESGEIDPHLTESLIQYVKENSGCHEVHHTRAGCTVSSHCGPGTLGVLFIEE